ncbi:hypothetical protein JZ751_029133 [Albula glossodonta]|uniref:Uncharacterized protein n=1 Tax=Albula glossodonta TaxID=121402 RepID=A0A8T2PAR7_9TELE|nr:hypothetical protein JZ751_029133 [Albula glossodonta]
MDKRYLDQYSQRSEKRFSLVPSFSSSPIVKLMMSWGHPVRDVLLAPALDDHVALGQVDDFVVNNVHY